MRKFIVATSLLIGLLASGCGPGGDTGTSNARQEPISGLTPTQQCQSSGFESGVQRGNYVYCYGTR